MIELRNVNKTYQMGQVAVRALNNVSLKISAGEFVAIMGPSGSGKSTLMHVLGLLDRPDSGEYYLGEKDLSKLEDGELAVIRNRLVGFIFQQFHLLPRMSALENAELPLIYAGKRHLKDKAREQIELVGLKDRILHKPSELSGGQQQRVAIARSLVNDPPIIMADEPTGNLDSKSKEEIIKILQELNEKGKTVIMVTHEKEVAVYARRILTVRDGVIVSDEIISPQKINSDSKITHNIIKEITSLHPNIAGGTKFWDYFRQAGFAVVSHKLRSALSILGILIGVAAVIAMLALGEGAKASIQKQLASLGSNLLVLRPGSSKVHGVSLSTGTVARFTFKDVEAIKKLPGVKRVSPSVTGQGQIVYGNKNWNTRIEGVGVYYADMRAAIPTVGRFFSEQEVKMREKVALLGMTVVKELFGDVNPVGETIKINLINFKVIGILPEKGSNTFRDQDDNIIVPVNTAMFRLFGKQYIDSINIEAESTEAIEKLKSSIQKLVIRLHRLGKNADEAFQIRDMADIKNVMTSTTKTMSVLLGVIAAISLFVGGIGIMNIMLVSVTERTREIGLRKAIGANNKDIMLQFLIESVLMSLLGGLSGIILGIGISVLITNIAGWTVKVSMFSVFLATFFSFIVGIVFGLWPAKQASRLDPIEALRYE